MEKIDLKKELKHLYNPSREKVSVADVPQMTFLMLDGLGDLRFEKFEEGKAAQIMHIGPYSEEGPTIATIHSFIEVLGGKLSGKHHEIYLSDPRKAAPEKLKTVLRQPFS